MSKICFNMVLILLSIILSLGAFTNSVKAQQSRTGEEPKKKHTLTFDDELIEGNVQKPELLYLLERKNFNFKKLIRLRENFLPEMAETSERLRGSGRSNWIYQLF